MSHLTKIDGAFDSDQKVEGMAHFSIGPEKCGKCSFFFLPNKKGYGKCQMYRQMMRGAWGAKLHKTQASCKYFEQMP
jgi:hypothetical protein